MAEDKRPPLPSLSSQASSTSLAESYADPFADRPRHLQFQEPTPRPFDSTVSLVPSEFGARSSTLYEDHEEKVPLTSSQGMSGSLYPPAYVPQFTSHISSINFYLTFNSPVDPNSFGDPYATGRPLSVASTASVGVESAWRRRQTIKRGVTRKVKLTKGNFIAEYAVPTPVYSAIEEKWKNTNSTEFSCVAVSLPTRFHAHRHIGMCDTPQPPSIRMTSPRQRATRFEPRCTIDRPSSSLQ